MKQPAGFLYIKEFTKEFNNLYSQETTSSNLHIMTIHKAKGLEFDTVFLPSLGARQKQSDKPLLRWLKVPTGDEKNLLLVSPLKAAHMEHCPLYDYLDNLDEEKNNYEAQRVLYVAVTRAKSRLYLMDSTEKSSKNSFRALLQNQEFVAEEPIIETSEKSLAPLKRLPLEFYQNQPLLVPDSDALSNFLHSIKGSYRLMAHRARFSLDANLARAVGTISHKLPPLDLCKSPQKYRIHTLDLSTARGLKFRL